LDVYTYVRMYKRRMVRARVCIGVHLSLQEPSDIFVALVALKLRETIVSVIHFSRAARHRRVRRTTAVYAVVGLRRVAALATLVIVLHSLHNEQSLALFLCPRAWFCVPRSGSTHI